MIFYELIFGLVPGEIFLDEIAEDENQQRQKNKIPDFTQNDTETWWTREPLKTLDLSSNSLTTLPDQIETLDYLIVLNVCSFFQFRPISILFLFRFKIINYHPFLIQFEVYEH